MMGLWLASLLLAGEVDLYPPPLELTAGEGQVWLDAASIVIGPRAGEPEQYAAERLATLVERRFGVTWPIVRDPAGEGARILLGMRETNPGIEEVCRLREIDLGPHRPGPDGFIIRAFPADGLVCVGGSDPRGVIYGAHALFRLLRSEDGRLACPAITVADRPAIPWRGRPSSVLRGYLEPGVMDAYAAAGINFIDIRDNARHSAPFGCEPEYELDRELVTEVIRQAHRRAMFVYGTVSCGVKPARFDAAIQQFENLIDLGVDGLWISFDDPGPGVDAYDLVARAVALGAQHGMTGRAIMTTPPSGSYQTIDTEFNRGLAKVPGMDEASWIFTRVPSKADREACAGIGLRRLPVWWHNWPRTPAGFSHGSYGGISFRTGGLPSYRELTPLSVGWHNPSYDKIRDAAENCEAVLQWGGWGEEYAATALALWAWNPARHDWELTRRRIYTDVFGPELVETARSFDDALAAVKKLYRLSGRSDAERDGWPPRLRETAERGDAEALFDRLDELLKRLERDAPGRTSLDPERLASRYLEPMRAEIETGRRLLALPDTRSWWPPAESRLRRLAAEGDDEGLAAESRRLRDEHADLPERLAGALTGLRGAAALLDLWRRRLSGDPAFWQTVLAARRKAFDRRMASLARGDGAARLAALAAALDQPPPGKVLAALSPDEVAAGVISSSGAWLTGACELAGRRAFVMSFPGHTGSVPGDFVEVGIELPVPRHEGPVHLQFYLNDEYDSDRWTRYRYERAFVDGEKVWEADIARFPTDAGPWVSVDVTERVKGKDRVRVTLRIEDRAGVGNYTTTVVVGAIRLVEAE